MIGWVVSQPSNTHLAGLLVAVLSQLDPAVERGPFDLPGLRLDRLGVLPDCGDNQGPSRGDLGWFAGVQLPGGVDALDDLINEAFPLAVEDNQESVSRQTGVYVVRLTRP